LRQLRDSSFVLHFCNLARKYTRPQGRTNEWLPSVRLAVTELVAAAKADRERERLAAEKAGKFAIGDV
jgi:hypothetical protein